MRGHVLDCEAGDKIIFIREISHCPQQVRRDGFGACFDAELHSPFCAVLVAYIEFWVRASFGFLEESHSAVRLITLAARTIEEIARCNIDWIAPKDSEVCGGCLAFGWSLATAADTASKINSATFARVRRIQNPRCRTWMLTFFVRVPEIGGQNTVQSRRSA